MSGEELTLYERASAWLAYGWEFLVLIPNWIPMAVSVASLAVSLAAYRRGAKPKWPKAWLEQVGVGTDGYSLRLVIENNTEHPIRVVSVSRKNGELIGTRLERPLVGANPWNPNQRSFYEYHKSFSPNSEVVPGSRFETEFSLSFSDTKTMSVPCIICSMYSNRLPSKCKNMAVLSMAPMAKPRQI